MEGQPEARPRRMRVAKEFKFHAAHVLPHHSGQCSRDHGHTYRLRVVVEGTPKPVLEGVGMSSEGMVCDFDVVKAIYREQIEPLVEHRKLDESLADLVPVTTCEEVAWWMAQVFAGQLWQRGLTLASLRLWETESSYAEVDGDAL